MARSAAMHGWQQGTIREEEHTSPWGLKRWRVVPWNLQS